MTSTHENITPEQAAALLHSGEAILIDVREPDEFRAEHIACALSLPLAELSHTFAQLSIPPDKKIVFHCLKGSRAEYACCAIGREGGTGKIYNMQDGITGWKSAGFPVIRSGRSGISMFRQVQITVGLMIVGCVLSGFAGLNAGFVLAGIIAGMLFFSGVTGWCGMALLLAKAPWNKNT